MHKFIVELLALMEPCVKPEDGAGVVVKQEPCNEDGSEEEEDALAAPTPHGRNSDKYATMSSLREQHPKRRLLRKTSSNASQEPLPNRLQRKENDEKKKKEKSPGPQMRP